VNNLATDVSKINPDIIKFDDESDTEENKKYIVTMKYNTQKKPVHIVIKKNDGVDEFFKKAQKNIQLKYHECVPTS
jgi:hypothetical protein